MWMRSTSEWLPSGCLPLGQAQAWTWPQLGRQRAGAAPDACGGPPLGPNSRDDLWPDQPGYGNATGYRPPLPGLESGLGWGCCRQATANDVSKRRPNFHHQLPSTKAVPDVGNDKRFNVGLLSDVPPGQRLAPVWRILWEQILAALDRNVRAPATFRWPGSV